MPYNLNSGYGQTIAEKLMGSTVAGANAYPTGGKTFLVAPTGHPNYGLFQELFTPDVDGLVRIYSTLAAALAQCTADRGDIIYLAEGYTETIVGAAGSGVTVAGVRVIGLGDGINRPTFTFTTAVAASFDITAARVVIQNCIFTCGIDAQTAMINVNKADVSFIDCEINTNSGTVGAILGILTAATATKLQVLRCRFLGPATNTGTTTTAQIQHESGTDYVIQGCYFTGKMTQAILNVATVLRGLVDNNRAVIATGTLFATFAAASTPFITNNVINVPSGTTPITAAAGFVGGNVYSAAAGVTAGTAKTF